MLLQRYPGTGSQLLGFEQVGVIMGQWFVGTRRASPQDKRLLADRKSVV